MLLWANVNERANAQASPKQLTIGDFQRKHLIIENFQGDTVDFGHFQIGTFDKEVILVLERILTRESTTRASHNQLAIGNFQGK